MSLGRETAAVQVAFYEAFQEEEEMLRKYLPASVSAVFTKKTIQESGDVVPPARIVSVRTQSVIPEAWAPLMDCLVSRSTGYDHVLRYRNATATALGDRKLVCGYLPLYCARAVAEHAALLWMSLFRKLPKQIRQFQIFERDGITGFECERKTLVVVGVGNIGSQVVVIGRGLGMNVIGVDIVHKFDWVTYCDDVDSALSQADVIVCAMNLTRANAGYFSEQRLRKCKKGVVFVNVSRGELSPVEPLLVLTKDHHIGGVGLDVYEDEQFLATSLRRSAAASASASTSSSVTITGGTEAQNQRVQHVMELLRQDNVLCTPHNAFNCEESVVRKSEQSAQSIVHFLQTGKVLWEVPLE
ncbi:D-isomer specific 2-hydroxyacid dehydrogenase NAD-binding [Pelomyxa schiedti]|nr:D-isomer specific 2-hydroxyacid dehydrogenase NAD-binding [Pelomyxa schiedti]